MKAPVLDTPAAWHAYLVDLAAEAHDRVYERGRPGSQNDRRRTRFVAEASERLAQAAQTIVCEIDLARGGER